jgi:hypothetical protein
VDFERVLETLLAGFDRQNIRYAAIGGFAMGVLGSPRTTLDLDFLVHRDDIDSLHRSMTALGYERRVHTENVSQYHHADSVWGAVDFVHAFREASLAMLARARAYPVFGGRRSIRVVDPEDVIGLKVQAMTNDPERRSQDAADIERLMDALGPGLDWNRVQDYYDLFGLGDEFGRLRNRFQRAH